MADSDINAFLKKRAAEVSVAGVNLQPTVEKQTSKVKNRLDNVQKPTSSGAKDEWAEPAQAEPLPKSKAVVNVSYEVQT